MIHTLEAYGAYARNGAREPSKIQAVHVLRLWPAAIPTAPAPVAIPGLTEFRGLFPVRVHCRDAHGKERDTFLIADAGVIRFGVPVFDLWFEPGPIMGAGSNAFRMWYAVSYGDEKGDDLSALPLSTDPNVVPAALGAVFGTATVGTPPGLGEAMAAAPVFVGTEDAPAGGNIRALQSVALAGGADYPALATRRQMMFYDQQVAAGAAFDTGVLNLEGFEVVVGVFDNAGGLAIAPTFTYYTDDGLTQIITCDGNNAPAALKSIILVGTWVNNNWGGSFQTNNVGTIVPRRGRFQIPASGAATRRLTFYGV